MERKYFRLPIDTYTVAIDKVKRPKYIGAFNSYSIGAYSDTSAYVIAEVKEEYYEKLIAKDDVSEFSKEDFEEAVRRLS